MAKETEVKEVDPHDIGITDGIMVETSDPNRKLISFSWDQLDLMADISSEQLGVILTFTQDQLDAIRCARERNAKRHVH